MKAPIMPQANPSSKPAGYLQSVPGIAIALITLSLLMATACSKKRSGKPANRDGGGSQSQASNTPNPKASSTGKIKFKKPGGATAFSLKLKDDGLKLVDANEKELARITHSESDKYKFKDAADKTLGYVTGAAPKFKIKDAAQEKTLFIFQRQEGGDWKLEDGDENLICKIGKRDYGWKIEDDTEKELAKVKTDGGRTSIRDSSDQTLFYTNDAITPLAAVPFGLAQLSQPQQAAQSAALKQVQ
jgi:hypothetical protein